MPAGFPSLSKTISMPPLSSARSMAVRLLAMGVRTPPSNDLTVLRPTLDFSANSPCDQFNHARAARHCSGAIIMMQIWPCEQPMSNFLFDIDHMSYYVLHQPLGLTVLWLSISYFRQQLGPCPCALFIRAAKT